MKDGLARPRVSLTFSAPVTLPSDLDLLLHQTPSLICAIIFIIRQNVRLRTENTPFNPNHFSNLASSDLICLVMGCAAFSRAPQ